MDKAHATSTPMIVVDIRKYLFRLKDDDEEVFGAGIPYIRDETGMTGDETGMTGDETGMTGDETGMTGDETGMTGDETGMTGDETR
ncbi:LOW QUALITY PROTEIN: hypothetical protein OSB04_008691 [Centaurea solstitialis]|uniref:Uncharacterized protein n=1 Tax=Centaurea solstitialis TaxID=347529 RepID=A0AA38TXT7_9ASTR|nr:LOW QUALITY PROTEIN: hypothetical protein OSB04_008691 [Centaurea solstitialis]